MSKREFTPGDSIVFEVTYFDSKLQYRGKVKEIKPSWLVVDYYNLAGTLNETQVKLGSVIEGGTPVAL
jgi:hypothetical protein